MHGNVATFTYERTVDASLIRYILTHEKVYGRASDDFAPPVAEFQPHMDGVTYVLLKRDGLALGLWAIVPHSPVLWELHTALLPHAWGPTAREAWPGFLEWLWTNTTCKRLITSVPEFNRAALKIGREWGFAEYGVNEDGFQKGNRMHNIHMLGLSRPSALNPEVVVFPETTPSQQQVSS